MPTSTTQKRRARVGIALVCAAFVLFVVYGTAQIGAVSCEVCMTFRGRADCRVVEGAERNEALRAAITNVCAQLASGVTDTLACERTQPDSASCQP